MGDDSTGDGFVTVRHLRHNELNAVTTSVDLVRMSDGTMLVRKVLGTTKEGAPERWSASSDPRRWNYWRREACAYSSAALRDSLDGTGIGLPEVARIDDTGRSITLWLEHVEGLEGSAFTLSDHVAIAAALGRWNARQAIDGEWTSRNFMRDYSTRLPIEDVAAGAWDQPRIESLWPPGLRDGWERLLAARIRLLGILERLPRVTAHLDLWPANALRRPGGEIALVDWAFSGDGAIGEDLGNHIPDSVFDLHWDHGRLAELEEAMVEAYTTALGDAGAPDLVDAALLGMRASAVKYAWLLPAELARAGHSERFAYFAAVDPDELVAARGTGLGMLARWAAEALDTADRIGW